MSQHTQMLKRAALTLVMAMASQVAVAQEQLGSFTVFIGKSDLTNDKGAALSEPWKVLRRDRANYHRFGVSQPGDQWDPYFGSSQSRKSLQKLVARGGVDSKAAQRLKNGGSILVRVFGQGGKPSAIKISVP
ncbi:hypothetical protein SAMN04488030_0598 [Aliiroseovarius halocynthiae]|uniref:Uncharacterized protein n=1 Tax=Aliiroseovarius halocynthiae TaxID=985055 RepID=A0A545SUD7_9RHOB|nr:hypothetical protein [Aliiroseovarius halocynthiae]TQV68572.1 hypothetical protein FIL88_03015 [Aliiroseovarius halocynthiae]SMR70978.1 hypothetical protein SAMN04488030_0598 [Aliiroseovarius halocynthiae]